MATPTKSWTTRDLLAWMNKAFEAADLDSPRRMSEMLLAHVLGCDRLRLYMETDRPASPLERDTLRDLVKRALNHEPIQYLVGEEVFFTMHFKVDSRVLIPRPSTLTIIEEVLQHARNNPADNALRESDAGTGIMIADICTGSGCIACALAKGLPGARVIATDISTDALEVAGLNTAKHKLEDRIELIAGDLLEPINAHPIAGNNASLNYICSNPPYIPDHEWAAVEPNVKDHEPTLALRAKDNGLEFVAKLIQDAPRLLTTGGMLLIEIASCTADQCLQLANDHELLTNARMAKDSDGLDRVLIATRT
ncbi:MAG: peptide chain release factor N(5)-glutamine methyltransferase [Phycisphaerales bacterium]|nr:peptide chain release factor N(5)-glutamine methyltransferase [Phycisphaerales bacterium]